MNDDKSKKKFLFEKEYFSLKLSFFPYDSRTIQSFLIYYGIHNW